MASKNTKVPDPLLYQKIIDDFRATGSVKRTSENCGTSEVTARRVLITEGLWESDTSRRVASLIAQGLTVEEAALALSVSKNAVQAYLPYSRGMYGTTLSENAEYSRNYRERISQAQKGVSGLTGEVKEENIQDVPTSGFDEPKETEEKKQPDAAPDNSGEKKRRPVGMKGNGIIYKLHLQLVGSYWSDFEKNLGLSKKDRDRLFKLGKAEKGFSRDILVPGNMTLHALNYAILKLFGWQNSHLHNFSLSHDDFARVTDNGLYGPYANLCGVLFRFVEDVSDAYWDDDYVEGISIRSWFRKKYSAPFRNGSIGDSYYGNLWELFRFNDRFPQFNYNTTLEEMGSHIAFDQDLNYLIERLSVCEVLLPKAERRPNLRSWLDNIERMIFALENEIEKENVSLGEMEDAANELMKWRDSNDQLDKLSWQFPDTYEQEVEERTGHPYEEVFYTNRHELRYWENKCKKIINDWNVPLEPYFREIYYQYDYGDGWCVKISVDDTFYRKYGARGEDGVYLDSRGEAVTEGSEDLFAVDQKGRPICIAADGLDLVDDCGGIRGYLDMLKTIHGRNKKEANEMLSWARMQGWSGKKIRPENML